MYLDPPLRRSVLIMLSINLCLTLIRQLIDFLGRLWLPITVNFLNLIILIFAIFGTIQFRTGFLSCFGTWTLCWLGWNAFLICFYLNIGNLDRNRAYMSFGMKGSHSFWVDHTPLCQTMYNHTLGHWVVSDQCYVQYYYVEVTQAAIHLLITSICIVLVIAYLQVIRSKSASSSPSRRSSSIRHPRVTMEFAGPEIEHSSFVNQQANGRVVSGPNTGDMYDGTSTVTGYMNTSFESSNTPAVKETEYIPSLDPSGQLIQNYRKSSKRKSKSKRRRTKSADLSDEDQAYPPDQQRHFDQMNSDYSRAPTEMLDDQTRYQQERLRQRQRSHSVDARNKQRERRRSRHRSVSPPNSGRPISSTTAESRLTPEVMSMHENAMIVHQQHPQSMNSQGFAFPQGIIPPRRGEKRTSSLKYKPFKHYATHGLSNLAPVNNETLGRSASQDQNMHHIHNNGEDLRDYRREPRRLSKAEPKCLMNSMDSMINPRMPPPPMTSLISFDPKSNNTLIRYHEHMARSQERLAASRSKSHETLSASVTDESSASIPSSSNPPPPPLLPPYKPLTSVRDVTGEPTYVQATRGRPPQPPSRASPSVIQQRQNQNSNQQQNLLNYYSVPPNHMHVEIASNDSGLPPSLNHGPGGSAPSSQGSEWSGSDDRCNYNQSAQQNCHMQNQMNPGYGQSCSQTQPPQLPNEASYQPRYSKGPHVTRPSHFTNYNPPINTNASPKFEPILGRSPVPVPYGSQSTIDPEYSSNLVATPFNDSSADSLPPPPPLPSNYDHHGQQFVNSQPASIRSSTRGYPPLMGHEERNINADLAQKSYRQEIVNNFLRDAMNQQQEQTKSIANLNPMQTSTGTPMINDRSLLV